MVPSEGSEGLLSEEHVSRASETTWCAGTPDGQGAAHLASEVPPRPGPAFGLEAGLLRPAPGRRLPLLLPSVHCPLELLQRALPRGWGAPRCHPSNVRRARGSARLPVSSKARVGLPIPCALGVTSFVTSEEDGGDSQPA